MFLSRHEAMLQAIVVQPNDDSLRLIYSDFLEDDGDFERAQLIRIQVEMRQLGPKDPKFPHLRQLEQALIRKNDVRWKSELPQFRGIEYENFESGLISSVRVQDPEMFLLNYEKILNAAPIQEISGHRFRPDWLGTLVALPEFARIRRLDLSDGNRIGNLGLQEIVDSPHSRQLTSLKLDNNNIGPGGLTALAQRGNFPHLTVLSLDRNALFADGLQQLAQATGLSSLKWLSMAWTQIDSTAMQALAEAPFHLRTLYASGNNISDAGWRMYAYSEAASELENLYLERTLIGDDAANALADSPRLQHLHGVYLRGNRITDLGATAIIESPHLQEIEEIILGDNAISAAMHDPLKQRFGRRVQIY
ncbi:MAG: TIGR02996 domain-containing protein [Zavarzinella sp.]